MKRILIVVLCIALLATMSIPAFASSTLNSTASAYDLLSGSPLGTVDVQTLIINQTDSIFIRFVFENELFEFEYELDEVLSQDDFNYYVAETQDYFSNAFLSVDGIITGMVRDKRTVGTSSLRQFGFMIAEHLQTLNALEYAVDNSFETAELNAFVAPNSNTSELLNTTDTLHVMCEALLGDFFAEVFANVTYSSEHRAVNITMYNINTTVPGDGCYLRKYDLQNVVYTLWASPTLPPQGAQYISGPTYLITHDFIGSLDATVSGWKYVDFSGLKVFYPGIYVDGVDF